MINVVFMLERTLDQSKPIDSENNDKQILVRRCAFSRTLDCLRSRTQWREHRLDINFDSTSTVYDITGPIAFLWRSREN